MGARQSRDGDVDLSASVTILGVTLYSGNLTTRRTVRVLN